MTQKDELTEIAKRARMYVRTYSPGDGVTRYRFFRYSGDDFNDATNDYFGPENGIYTALGIKEALAFANKIGEVAEAEGHHPDMKIGWGKVNVELSTHAIKGLSENDFIFAAKINEL